MAIIYGQGYAPTARRNLLARSDIREMKIFVLHDADIDGYNIARTLAEATRRMPDHTIDVIDLGLTVPQAIELGLETEKFTRRKELPADLELDDNALEWFTGDPIEVDYGAKPQWSCQRCELNAFSADGLAEFIEAGLQRHGATEKLVPPEDVLSKHVETVRDNTLTDLVAVELGRMADMGAVVRQLLADNPNLAEVVESDVRDRFADHRTESWRTAARELVHEDIAAADGLAGVVHRQLEEQLRSPRSDHPESSGP